jgi:N-acetylmuramoyl-L-alanine amidase
LKSRAETKRIIFHHSLSNIGDVKRIRAWHLDRGYDDIGYHYVIPREGNFQSGRKVQLVGAHAAGKNFDSIGVCLVGMLNEYAPTDSQICESAKLYHDLCRAYSSILAIEFHHELCPGKFLDREVFTNTLRGSL